ncbi:hypothetical protein HJC23_007812 [Cyclotella cryptica]|uniref:SOUL heme-binding protein n=1 Tax=Cyclotella cryptica TaxID=29204 RepID=A0ABD3R394_9STRA|eukprot:CCRYP_000101-RA/>CCRYP_000101-RA protein AED:0.00 eAED:0.00 QI:87/-1/1/1/-1/1/1/278/282
MGNVFGKQTVAEPPFDVLLDRDSPDVTTSYEIRKYGQRFAATCAYVTGKGNNEDMNEPFTALANYIGVFGKAQNEGDEKISMTAPVVLDGGSSSPGNAGTTIDMTAPVVTESGDNGQMVMKFMLPAKYDELSKIPKPLDPSVRIEEVPPQTGAVHRYNGRWNEDRNREIALDLGRQLMQDGVSITQDFVGEHWQFWGYNPPFTIPHFRRNEIWLELNEEQVDYLMEHYSKEGIEGGVTVASLDMEVHPLFRRNVLNVGSLAIMACLAVGVFIKSRRSQYSRL